MSRRVTSEELQKLLRRDGRRRKYSNRPAEEDGLRFDSQKELRRYRELKLLRAAGEVIQFLTHTPTFRLPGGVTYTADFLVWWADGRVEIEDTKGVRTEAYRNKKRQVEELYAPLTITEL